MKKKMMLAVVCFQLAGYPMVGSAGDLLQTMKRAKQGDADARFELGKHYSTGRSARYDEAARWLLLAAEQGHVDAQERLRSMKP